MPGDRSEAHYLLQEASVIALEKLGSSRSGPSFEAWMGRIVRLVALNRLRKHRPLALEYDWRPGSATDRMRP
jgi:DNA-directed RNA polymerase specialized sigma24 family protein